MKQTRRSFLHTASVLGAALPFAPMKLSATEAVPARHADSGAGTGRGSRRIDYRVGFLGTPDSQASFEMTAAVPWTAGALGRLQALGFNTIQLNVAWGSRPGDEPLNLEDIVALDAEQDRQYPQVVPLRCQPGAEAREKRRVELRQRLHLCKAAGMRTIFHFGAPYNAHSRYGDGPPNCLMDPAVSRRYELLLDVLAREFPGVDDILVYTYDQDAWLCSEFGPCPRCLGLPLHQRVVPFLDRLAAHWRGHSPAGRLWWEPWELSAGQVLACVQQIEPTGVGLALHSNIAEVMATLPVDRWLKNTADIARQRDIPVIVEYWLGGPSEELEPLSHLAHPLVTLRGLKAIAAVPGVVGIKEYFGLNPGHEDPNLRMTGLFFDQPSITEADAMQALASPYGRAAREVIRFWQLASEGMELFPWDTSWFIREIGRSRTDHALTAAMLRGQQVRTPSWCSTRHAIFMKADNTQPDPWMLEDVQLRCQLAADRWAEALAVAQSLEDVLPGSLAADFAQNLIDLGRLRRRTLAYVFHLRETNLATILRKAGEMKVPMPAKTRDELLATLRADLENHRAEMKEPALPGQELKPWDEMERAIAQLQQNAEGFLQNYLQETPAGRDRHTKGHFSVTSR